MKENPTRREALQVGAGAAACIVIGTTAQAANNVIQSPELEKRMKALSECTWEGFQGDKISLSNNTIVIGDITIGFDDLSAKMNGNDVEGLLSVRDIEYIFSIVGGNESQKAFVFREVFGFKNAEYWLSNRASTCDYDEILDTGRPSMFEVSNDSVKIGRFGDGWGSIDNELYIRQKL